MFFFYFPFAGRHRETEGFWVFFFLLFLKRYVDEDSIALTAEEFGFTEANVDFCA